MIKILLLLFFVAFCCSLDLKTELKYNGKRFKQHFDELHSASGKLSKGTSHQQAVGDMSVECALCGILINQVEVTINEIKGFVQENISQTEIEAAIKNDICVFLSGDLKSVCDDIVKQLPSIINSLEHRWDVSVTCVDLGLCTKPFQPHNETQEVDSYIINLDLPPQKRFLEVCSVPKFQKQAQFLVGFVQSVLADGGKYLSDVGKGINELIDEEFAQEIQGCATKLGVNYGWLTLMNIGYEVSDACTSIVMQTLDNKIYHGRNLDFWSGYGFTDSLKNMTFQAEMQKNGKTEYYMSTFAGFVGALSGQRPHVFSVTIDTRFYPQGIGELFYEVVAAITEKNASLVSFLAREALARETTFNAAVNTLSNGELIADVYYTTAGITNDEGIVITRNRHNATNIWQIDVPSRFFLVETNYDHWKPAPWFDDRRGPANHAMEKMGRAGISKENLFKVMSTKPVLNLQTTYTIISIPDEGYYKTYTRYCPYPCTQ